MSGNNFQLTLRIDQRIDKWRNETMQLSWNRTLIFEYFEGEKSTYLFALNAFVSLCCFGLALKIIFLKKQITWKFHLEFLDLSLQINYIFELLQRIYLAMQKLHNFEAL